MKDKVTSKAIQMSKYSNNYVLDSFLKCSLILFCYELDGPFVFI